MKRFCCAFVILLSFATATTAGHANRVPPESKTLASGISPDDFEWD